MRSPPWFAFFWLQAAWVRVPGHSPLSQLKLPQQINLIVETKTVQSSHWVRDACDKRAHSIVGKEAPVTNGIQQTILQRTCYAHKVSHSLKQRSEEKRTCFPLVDVDIWGDRNVVSLHPNSSLVGAAVVRSRRDLELALLSLFFLCLMAAWLNEVVVRAVALLSALTKQKTTSTALTQSKGCDQRLSHPNCHIVDFHLLQLGDIKTSSQSYQM